MKISSDRIILTQELYALVVDYWHDVDTNWGRQAPEYYTEDGEFIGPAASYKGREKIRAFYKWREDRGARTVIHAVANFQVIPESSNRVTCHWFLMLYAADGKPVLPTHPPIQIAYMTDKMVRDGENGWLVESRRFENWFEGGTPATNPNLDEK
jgi:hypothetical protein